MIEPLNTQSTEELPSTDGFVLKYIAVSCLECHCSFATPSLLSLPPVTEYDTIEADLHRVLPDAEVRASLIAVCPHCNYATWTVRFRISGLNPEMLPEPQPIAHSKKFALAVKHAREKGVSPLDIAFIAINGLYCAREAGEDSELWLELAAYEQSRGLTEELLIPATGQDHLVMAELWRQLGSFDRALEEYALAADDDFIPRELLEQQVALAKSENTSPVTLPPYLVREMFPESQNYVATLRVGKNGRPVPPNIVRRPRPDKLAMVDFGPPERRPALSSAVQDDPVPEEEIVKVELEELAPVAEVEQPATEVKQEEKEQKQEKPEKQEAKSAAVADTVDVNKVRHIIAQPQGASAIYLVQAAQIPQLDAPSAGTASGGKNGNGRKKKPAKQPQPQKDPLPQIEMPTNEYFSGAASPQNAPGASQQPPSATQRAVNKALKAKKEDPTDRFPEIQLTDDEQYEYQYGGYAEEYDDEDDQQIQPGAPAAQQGSEGNGKSDYSDAVAQVESFLSLTRQSSYQSWIRGYRR